MRPLRPWHLPLITDSFKNWAEFRWFVFLLTEWNFSGWSYGEIAHPIAQLGHMEGDGEHVKNWEGQKLKIHDIMASACHGYFLEQIETVLEIMNRTDIIENLKCFDAKHQYWFVEERS